MVEAPAQDIWDVLTAYEELPKVVPNILSNVVTRHANGAVTIEQSSLISRRLNLVTEMTLDVKADEEKRSLVLTRTSGHGFLEFVGSYTLKPQGNGATYLQYIVQYLSGTSSDGASPDDDCGCDNWSRGLKPNRILVRIALGFLGSRRRSGMFGHGLM